MAFCAFAAEPAKEDAKCMQKYYSPESGLIVVALLRVVDICATTKWTMQFVVHITKSYFPISQLNSYFAPYRLTIKRINSPFSLMIYK